MSNKIPERAKELLREFIECGKPPYNKSRAFEVNKELSELGYMIWISSDEYSIVPKELARQLLFEK